MTDEKFDDFEEEKRAIAHVIRSQKTMSFIHFASFVVLQFLLKDYSWEIRVSVGLVMALLSALHFDVIQTRVEAMRYELRRLRQGSRISNSEVYFQ